jgi:UPF0271 protein
MKALVDLNSDLGESFGAYTLGNDGEVMEFVTSANVACGFHAGDPSVMLKTVKLAIKKGVAVGAHPGHPDLVGFGRRKMSCTPEEVYAFTLYQIGSLRVIARANGRELQHVKAHGALYNQAASDPALAEAIASAVKDAGGSLILVGLANSAFRKAAEKAGVPLAEEAFADREYMPDGSLMPRSRPGAVIHDPEVAARRVLRMVKEGIVTADGGVDIALKPDTICLHGDTPEAVENARKIREILEASDVTIMPMEKVIASRDCRK